MNVKGRVVSVLPAQTGEGKNGKWVKATYIIETGGQYPKKVAVTIWGDSLPVLKEGQDVDCSVEVESKEFNGKWYTEVKCWKVDFVSGTPKTSKVEDPMKDASDAARPQIVPADHFETPDGADSLPF